MNTMGMITIAKFLEEHNASVNLMNLFEAMCSDFIKLQQETNAAQEKNIEASNSADGKAGKVSLPEYREYNTTKSEIICPKCKVPQ